MAKSNGLTVGEVMAFAARVKAALEGAESDRRTVAALRAMVTGSGSIRLAGRPGRPATSFGGRLALGRRGFASAASDKKILDLMKGKKSGVAAGDLIKSLRVNRKALNRTLRRLRDEGKVKMTGKKRLARYFLT
jgi:hypothetical protein